MDAVADDEAQRIRDEGERRTRRHLAQVAVVEQELATERTRPRSDASLISVEQAAAIVDARLGRAPQDALEASVVLEAWGGIRPGVALDLSAQILDSYAWSPEPATSRRHPAPPARRMEQVVLLYGVLLVATWLPAFADALDSSVPPPQWRIVLPVAMAAVWGVQRRLRVDDPGGHVTVAPGPIVGAVTIALGVGVLGWGSWGLVTGSIVCVWTATALLRRVRSLVLQTAVLVATPIAVHGGVAPEVVLTVAAVASTGIAAADLHAGRHSPRLRPAPWSVALSAAVSGVLLGALFVLLPDVRDAGGDALVAWGFVPALFAGIVGVDRLARLWIDLPAALDTEPVVGSAPSWSRRVVRDAVVGGLVRFAVVAGVCSAVYQVVMPDAEGGWFSLQVGVAGLVTMVTGLLDAIRQPASSVGLLAVSVGLVLVLPGAVGAVVGLVAVVLAGLASVAVVARDPGHLLARPD